MSGFSYICPDGRKMWHITAYNDAAAIEFLLVVIVGDWSTTEE